ncbi:hypothetical protein ACTXT7_000842 [Hymenolepis weldensis]
MNSLRYSDDVFEQTQHSRLSSQIVVNADDICKVTMCAHASASVSEMRANEPIVQPREAATRAACMYETGGERERMHARSTGTHISTGPELFSHSL